MSIQARLEKWLTRCWWDERKKKKCTISLNLENVKFGRWSLCHDRPCFSIRLAISSTRAFPFFRDPHDKSKTHLRFLLVVRKLYVNIFVPEDSLIVRSDDDDELRWASRGYSDFDRSQLSFRTCTSVFIVNSGSLNVISLRSHWWRKGLRETTIILRRSRGISIRNFY